MRTTESINSVSGEPRLTSLVGKRNSVKNAAYVFPKTGSYIEPAVLLIVELLNTESSRTVLVISENVSVKVAPSASDDGRISKPKKEFFLQEENTINKVMMITDNLPNFMNLGV